jgi:hypothetical protein
MCVGIVLAALCSPSCGERPGARWDAEAQQEAVGPGSPDPSGHAFGSPPRFDDYPARERFRGEPAPPDVSRHAEPARFGAALRIGAKRGPDFAGHYTIVSRSCGRLCREFVIVDAATGRVFPGLTDTPPFEYRIDSRLIVFEAPQPLPGRIPCAGCSAAYYVWENDRLEIVPPETWVGSAPPPPSIRLLIDSLRTVERPLLENAGPAVIRPTWDRLVIAARDGSRQILADRLEADTIALLHVFRGPAPAVDHVLVEVILLRGQVFHLDSILVRR